MDELMRDLERDARARSDGLEAQGKLPAGSTAQHYPLTPHEHAELQRHKVAMFLADGPDTFLALLRGGKIPSRWYKQRLSELLRR